MGKKSNKKKPATKKEPKAPKATPKKASSMDTIYHGREYAGKLWCSFTKRYLPIEAFNRNASKPSGYSTECRLAKKAGYDEMNFMKLVQSLPKSEQKFYV